MYALSCKSGNKTPVANDDSLVVKTVQEFYEWYIHEAYPRSTSYYQVPYYKKLDETTYVFDLEEYKKRLSSLEYFSEGYKQRLMDRLQACNQEMKKVEWEYEPEPMFNIKACNYLWGNQWVGGQGELITGFRVDSVEASDGRAKTIVSILVDDRVFVQSILFLKKENDEYKIDDITLNWKQ